MSVRTEWANARQVGVEVHKPGMFEDAYGSKNDEHALALWSDECFVIEGTPQELRALLNQALSALSRIP